MFGNILNTLTLFVFILLQYHVFFQHSLHIILMNLFIDFVLMDLYVYYLLDYQFGFWD